MNTNSGLARSTSFRIARGVAFELIPLLAVAAGWALLDLSSTLPDTGRFAGTGEHLYDAAFLVWLGFFVTSVGWFAEGHPAIGAIFAGVRGASILTFGFLFLVILGRALSCDGSGGCSDVWLTGPFIVTGVVAFVTPIISAVWLAITIAREPRDPSPADAGPHFAAEGA